MAKKIFKLKNGVKLKRARVFGALAAVIVLFVGAYFLYMNTGRRNPSVEELMQNGKFAQGIKVNGVDIGGLTYNEGKEKVDPVAFAKVENFEMTIVIDDKKFVVDGDDINAYANTEDTLKQAIVVGKIGTRKERRREISTVKKEGREFFLRYIYDSDLMEQQLTKIQEETGMAAQDATVKIESGNIVYIEGKKGIKIDKEKLEADVSAAMDANLEKIEIKAQTVETEPTVTVADLKERLVRKSGTTTEFKSSTSARADNVVKAAGLLNGQMIAPGATFSINSVLGARTSANGWSMATAISGGKYIDDVGGGVCQVSSTLYNSAVKAGLEIVERRKHTYPVSYLPVGHDATISTGGPDLKIRNTYDFPVYIVASASKSSRKLDVMIYGPKNEDGGSYNFKSKEIENKPPTGKATVKENSNLLEGEYVEITPRKNRIVVERWTEYVVDGKVIRTNKMSTDSYEASNGEYAIGKGTKIDGSTGKPQGKKVSDEYLTKKRETTTKATTAATTAAPQKKTEKPPETTVQP